jgi:hypothetical protein
MLKKVWASVKVTPHSVCRGAAAATDHNSSSRGWLHLPGITQHDTLHDAGQLERKLRVSAAPAVKLLR